MFSSYRRLRDLIYSLWFTKEYCQKTNQKCIFHIQTNVKIAQPSWLDVTHMNSNILFTRQSAEFIKPLLQKCQFIDHVMIGDTIPVGAIDLNKFRSEAIGLYSGDLRDYYYNFGDQILPREFWKPILDVQSDYRFKDKILLTLTERYVNVAINYTELKQFADKIVFMGTEKEYNLFCKKYFEVSQFVIPKTLLEAAQYMKGSLGYISNQTGFFALAEALKVPRILFPVDWMYGPNYQVIPGPKNVLPLGGRCQNISKNQMIKKAVKEIFFN